MQVLAAHAHCGVVERLFRRTAETHLGEHPLQLTAHRRADFLRDCLQTLHEREAGAQRARQQRQRVRQLVLERALAATLLLRDVHDRRQRGDRRGNETVDQPTDGRDAEEQHHDRRRRVEEHLACAHRHVGALERLLDPLQYAGALGELVRERDRLLHHRGLGRRRRALHGIDLLHTVVTGKATLERSFAPAEDHTERTDESHGRETCQDDDEDDHRIPTTRRANGSSVNSSGSSAMP